MQFTSIFILVILILVVSNGLTLYFLKKKPGKTQDFSELELLSDLVNNHRAMIEIRRIDPAEIFLRSPKSQL
jgi:hypothetical protein